MSQTKKGKVFVFAMGDTGNVLCHLKNIDCRYLVFPNNQEKYLEILLHEQPKHILGLGSYSGIDQEKIRIEKICSNKFRNDYIGENQHMEIKINYYLEPTEIMKIAKGIGNSHCNQISWKIMQMISQGKLHSHYTFLHIPKTMKWWIAANAINKSLISPNYL